jgi:hypothetical protein
MQYVLIQSYPPPTPKTPRNACERLNKAGNQRDGRQEFLVRACVVDA